MKKFNSRAAVSVARGGGSRGFEEALASGVCMRARASRHGTPFLNSMFSDEKEIHTTTLGWCFTCFVRSIHWYLLLFFCEKKSDRIPLLKTNTKTKLSLIKGVKYS